LFSKIIRKNAQKVLEAYNSKDFKGLIEQEAERIVQFIETWDNISIENELIGQIDDLNESLGNYNLELPTGKKIEDLQNSLDNRRKKLVFREEFGERVRGSTENITITNEEIDAYFNTGLTAEQAANAYGSSRERILPKEIVNGQAIFAGKVYDLANEAEFKSAKEDKAFIYDFREGNVPENFTDDNILAYRKFSPDGSH